MTEVEIGQGKSARLAYGFDDIAIVPSRRTRDPQDIDLSWEVDAYKFEVPVLAAASDSITSPATAIEMGQLGGGGVLNLEGLWTRYEDPMAQLAAISEAETDKTALTAIHKAYAEPIKERLIVDRIRQIKDAGVTAVASMRPQSVIQYAKFVAEAELDLFVIQGTAVSAEHVSKHNEPLNLKHFIREFDIPTIVGGCASYQAALHLMRTGAMGVLVGVGRGERQGTHDVLGVGVPQATIIADARGARMRHLDETGVYCHVVADGSMLKSSDIAKAIVCGADAVMVGFPLASAANAPGRGTYWPMTATQTTVPRGHRVNVPPVGSLEEILLGPTKDNNPNTNLLGALRESMATCGYATLKEFQKAEIVVSPTGACA